ncbi:MAG: hypothetical protein RJA36_1323 [Pseudomonadota bacterium]|jgi:hypothetical protein
MNAPQIRLAFRKEGRYVNAYHASMHSMAGAVLMGSILVSLCERNPGIFEIFKALMKDAMSAMITNATGATVSCMTEQAAPEHEKAGHG